MKIYRPADTVLPAFTDEALRAETGFMGEVAALLLTLPPEYRQPHQAELAARTIRVCRRPVGVSSMPEAETIDTGRDEAAIIADEIRAQLAAGVVTLAQYQTRLLH